ncbi:MAG: hypothetical protein WCQ99_10465 [Pseudomonadota bacterium]
METQQSKHEPEHPAENCAACGKKITRKPVKRMGNFYCSLYCAELMRERLENLDMTTIDFNALGPVVDRFMSTCQVCPLPLKCREDRPVCSAYFEELHEHITMRWCCHCIYGLSCMLSDGSVKLATIKKIMRKAEQIAREKNAAGVNQAIMAMAEGELMDDFSYAPFPDVRPAPPKEEHDHYMACMQCDKKFMDECFKVTEEAEKNIPRIEALLGAYPYCGHMHYEMAGMLLNPCVTLEKIQKLTEKTKQIAKEKGCNGGLHRLHYIAVGRSIQGE